jgi:hypothetical protein
MKNLILFGLIILALVCVQFVQAQTMEEIISRHVEAMGGRQKIITLTSALMTGTFTATGTTSPITIAATKKHMRGSRIDIEANGTSNFQLITPNSGWIFTPVQGDKEPRPLQEDQVKTGQVQLDLHGPFIDYKEKGNKIEMAGKETVDGVICYKLKVTAPNTNVTEYFISSKTNWIVKTRTKMFQFGNLEDVETLYSEHKQNADGYWFAYTNVGPRGTTRYENILTNVTVDEKIFAVK